MSEDGQLSETKHLNLGKKKAHVFGQLLESKHLNLGKKRAHVFGQLLETKHLNLGKKKAPVLADELNTVVDEDQGDFAELCLLFRVQERVVQRVAQLLQDWQKDSELLRREQIIHAF